MPDPLTNWPYRTIDPGGSAHETLLNQFKHMGHERQRSEIDAGGRFRAFADFQQVAEQPKTCDVRQCVHLRELPSSMPGVLSLVVLAIIAA